MTTLNILPLLDKSTIYMFADCIPITSKLYGDHISRYLATSTNSNKYILVVYDNDYNIIYVQGIPSGT